MSEKKGTFLRAALTPFVVMALATPVTATAQKQKDNDRFVPDSSHRVEANSEYWVDLNICSPNVTIEAHGDDDTDVDFTIYDQRNNQVYQDLDLDDDTVATIRSSAGNGTCLAYRMKLKNLGNVWNMVRVTVADVNVSNRPSVGSYRVEANREFWVDLSLCARQVRIVGRGDGDTDVDYTLYDRNNNVVHQDLSTSDQTDFTVATGAGSSCAPHRLKLNNLGNVWNQVEVTIYDLR